MIDAPFPTFDAARPIAMIGCGLMGVRIAEACLRRGLPVKLHDIEAARVTDALKALGSAATAAGTIVTGSTDLGAALADVQLAFENVPEVPALKQGVLAEVGQRLSPEAYMGSNTSSLLCSPLAAASGRPERFFNMNFSDPRKSRMVELMGGDRTAPATIDFAKAWAHALDLSVLHVRREQRGYAFNRLWRVIKRETLRQIAAGIVTPEDIDRAWMLAYDRPSGPCGTMDRIGLATVLAIEDAYFAESGDEADRPPEFLRRMVAEGRIGVQSGEGFYRYPNPSFEAPDFLERG